MDDGSLGEKSKEILDAKPKPGAQMDEMDQDGPQTDQTNYPQYNHVTRCDLSNLACPSCTCCLVTVSNLASNLAATG